MPESYDIEEIEKMVAEIKLEYRFGSKCLVSKRIKIKDLRVIPVLEKIEGIEVFGDEFRRYHEFK